MSLIGKFLGEFKKILEKKYQWLQKMLKRERQEPEFGSDVDSFEEETDETVEFSNRLAVQQTLKEEIEEVEEALNKIKENKYGICEKCGKEISLDLLKIDPESKLCKDCKKAQNKRR